MWRAKWQSGSQKASQDRLGACAAVWVVVKVFPVSSRGHVRAQGSVCVLFFLVDGV